MPTRSPVASARIDIAVKDRDPLGNGPSRAPIIAADAMAIALDNLTHFKYDPASRGSERKVIMGAPGSEQTEPNVGSATRPVVLETAITESR